MGSIFDIHWILSRTSPRFQFSLIQLHAVWQRDCFLDLPFSRMFQLSNNSISFITFLFFRCARADASEI